MSKLGIKLEDEALAQKLIEAGLDTPRKIRDAKNSDLEKAVGRSGKDKVRAKLPK